jgi:hypothetical protein
MKKWYKFKVTEWLITLIWSLSTVYNELKHNTIFHRNVKILCGSQKNKIKDCSSLLEYYTDMCEAMGLSHNSLKN